MSLVKHLKRTGVTTGPLRSPTRHSDLSTLKSFILGEKISFGFKAYNNFGSAFHNLKSFGKIGKYKLTEDERKRVVAMASILNHNRLVRRLEEGVDTREKRRSATLSGVKIRFTPDADGKLILDWKTTTCADQESFERSAFKYGYFRQGETYSRALGLKEYWIIGIQKFPPYRVFPVPIFDKVFKSQMSYVAAELEFLLYFYSRYGKPKKFN